MMVHMDPEWINYKFFEKVNNNLEPLKTLRNKNSTFLMAFLCNSSKIGRLHFFGKFIIVMRRLKI